MKLTVRIFALALVFAGVTAAVKSPAHSLPIASQSATAKMPTPVCIPGYPMCPTQGGPTVR